MRANAVASRSVSGLRPDTTTKSHPAVRVALQAIVILAFAFATALAAQVKIPVPGTVVPATLQTAVVLLAGLRLGARRGALSQAIYIGAGALGLPFFAGASGAAVLVGPTGGYLVGFILAAWAAGAMNAKFGAGSFKFVRSWLIAFAASLLIFIPGVIQLKFFTAVDWSQAVVMGVFPFIVGDLLKVSFAATAYSLIKR